MTRESRDTDSGTGTFDQAAFRVRFGWGRQGLLAVGPGCDAIVVVDVLSFSTCVDVAVSRGASVFPCALGEEAAADHARRHGALLASKERGRGFSLSARSLTEVPSGTRLVLPSPNGSALSALAAKIGATYTACLRNAGAVSRFLDGAGGVVGVVAAGECWPDGSMRPAWEDLVGAGAIVAAMSGPRSPEAEAACAAFERAASDLRLLLLACGSGRELEKRGFGGDVELAAELDVSASVPRLDGSAFVAGGSELS